MSFVYVLDTNFFIQAHRVSYPIDVVQSFWQKLALLAHQGKIFSIDKVKEEIFNNDDDLKDWCQKNLSPGFWKDSKIYHNEYSSVVTWATEQTNRYSLNAIQEFCNADEADAFLIAYALTKKDNIKIVTNEISSNTKRKIKIPDVCDNFDLKYIEPIKMFRELGESF